MDRPLYETDGDRSREADFLEKICRVWRCTANKLPNQYRLDYACSRNGKITAWLEIKCRNNTAAAFDTYMLSVKKWMSGVQYFNLTSAPFILAVRFTDEDRFFKYATTTAPFVDFTFKGRTVQTRDEQDAEPCVFIPISFFKRF